MIESQERSGVPLRQCHQPIPGVAWRIGAVPGLTLIFVAVYSVFFLLNTRIVNLYDEGILLTAVMRTMHGQVLHRDFYYNYGPAQLYIFAGLFKLFGSSVLVERLTAYAAASFLATSIYALGRRFSGRLPSFAALICCIFWMIGESLSLSLLLCSVCILVLWSTYLTVQTDDAPNGSRGFMAGLLVGILFAFRYDMGIMVVAAQAITIGLFVWLRGRRNGSFLNSAASRLKPYLFGFVTIAAPLMIAYVAVAPLHDLLYDIVIYTAKYYRAGRGLPPPSIFGPTPNDLVVYVLPIALGLVFYVAWASIATCQIAAAKSSKIPAWVEFIFSLGIVSAFLSVKGIVRLSAGTMYACLIPCLLLGAILYEHRDALRLPLRALFFATVAVFFATGFVSLRNVLLQELNQSASTLKWVFVPAHQAPFPPNRSWCEDRNPITEGFCYLLSPDDIQTVEYLNEHTTPKDTLYVGLPRHDRIIMNNNLLYFAVQRLPATKWSHFDPFLQNRADVQLEMIGELERNKPPYVVLDSRFDQAHEPNGSSVSTGVHILDGYIAAHYSDVQTFGVLRILKRQ